MKKKIWIISAVSLFVIVLAICVFFTRGQSSISVFFNGKQIGFSGEVYEKDGSIYVCADDFFKAADEKYSIKEDTVTVGGKSLKGELSGKRVMVNIKSAAESVGGEINISENSDIYIIKTVPIKFKFRDGGGKMGYSDGVFAPDSSKYNHALSKMSLALAVSSFSSRESDKYWGENKDCNREKDGRLLLSDMGFSKIKAYNYDISLNDKSDKAAFLLGEKKIKIDGKRYTLIAAAIRGGGYGNEWVSNLNLGKSGNHSGFNKAAKSVKAELMKYIGKRKNVKVWITGYSRGGAVANLLAASISGSGKIEKSNIYAYTFAAPKGAATPHKNSEKYNYIFNIISKNDLVPYVAPSDWGFFRYGTDITFPYLSSLDEAAEKEEAENIKKAYTAAGGKLEYNPLEIERLNLEERNFNTVKNISSTIGSREKYAEDFQALIMDFIECSGSKLKNKDGKWKWAAARRMFIRKYGEEGEEVLRSAESNSFLSGAGQTFGGAGEAIVCFGAVCIKHGKNPYNIITKDIGLANLVTVATVFSPNSDKTNEVSFSHYPEVYMSWLFGFSDTERLTAQTK